MATNTKNIEHTEKIYQDIDAKFLGRMLKYRREAARMTQQEAADRIGLSLSYYKNMERGTNNPSIPSLYAALFTYNISILYCFLHWRTTITLHIGRLSACLTDALNPT